MQWLRRLLRRPGCDVSFSNFTLSWVLPSSVVYRTIDEPLFATILFSVIFVLTPYTCYTFCLSLRLSLCGAIAVRALQGLHHSKAVPVGSRMSV